MSNDLNRRAFLIGTGCAVGAAATGAKAEPAPRYRVFTSSVETRINFCSGVQPTRMAIVNTGTKPARAWNGMVVQPGQHLELRDGRWMLHAKPTA